MYRHGDVMIVPFDEVPFEATKQAHLILMRGEITGHSHRIAERDAAELWEHRGMLYLRVTAPQATLVHEEHNAIELPRGIYRVWAQREYTPREIIRIVD